MRKAPSRQYLNTESYAQCTKMLAVHYGIRQPFWLCTIGVYVKEVNLPSFTED